MNTTLEPRADRLLVEPIDEERVTKSGIILPEQAREKPQRGRIIALGPAVGQDDPEEERLALGDEVLYSKYGGTELKVDGAEVILLRETDVFARVREDTAVETDASKPQP